MEQPILTNKNQFPTEEIIFSHLGKNKSLWISVFDYIHSNHSDLTELWKYYNDGKSWLMKVTRKSKTICWVSVIKNSFRMTFYFNSKADQILTKSNIPDNLKKQYRTGMKTKKFNSLTIIFKRKADVETAKSLISLKLSLK